MDTVLEIKRKEMGDIFETTPIVNIKVMGIGGGGCNSINRMLEECIELEGVEFIAVNTDKQALSINKAGNRMCIGERLTKGWGAGTNPNIGQRAAEESYEEIRSALEGADLVFLTAGMGGGTGTGAIPVIASIAKELGILTVAVVTKPFDFEGAHRMVNAEIGIQNLSRYVDAYIVVPNQKLIEKLPPKTNMKDAFKIADEVLRQGVIGLAEVIVKPILINVDYADIRNILQGAGITHMGVGSATGDDRVLTSIRQAVASPLIETSINGATGIILCIKSGESISMSEVSHYSEMVRDLVDPGCNFKYGLDIDPKYGDEVEVLIIASGFNIPGGRVPESQSQPEQTAAEPEQQTIEAVKEPNVSIPPFFKNFKNFK
jgi:cell division protein FtsZ